MTQCIAFRIGHRKLVIEFFAVFLVFSLAPLSAAIAGVELDLGESNEVPRILVRGEISDDDVTSLAREFSTAQATAERRGFPNEPSSSWVSVVLDSNGGSVDAAMRMGKILRERGPVSTTVPSEGSCISACVLVLAGAPRRNVFGRVGVHRPYFAADIAETSLEQQTQYEALLAQIKRYLAEMNVSEQLADLMMRIPPERSRYLSLSEAEEFGLHGDDPYVAEANDSALARSLGISKAELVRRKTFCADSEGAADYKRCIESK